MQALIKDQGVVRLEQRPLPQLTNPFDVRVQVALAGLCRTDIAVARGELPSLDPLVLGHEFCGLILEVGEQVRQLRPGMRVGANPMIACGCCLACTQQGPALCTRSLFLGLSRDGAFAEQVVVPAQNLYPLPDTVDDRRGAYLEPLAAAMAVLHTPIQKHQRGIIYGSGRIAGLTQQVLQHFGFEHITLIDENSAPLEAHSYHFAIETQASSEVITRLVEALQPRGLLILKSRQPRPLQISPLALVEKEICMQAVHYGSFEAALDLLALNALNLHKILGRTYALSEYEAVFAGAHNEQTKIFFDPARG